MKVTEERMKAIDEAELMPELRHNYEREDENEFDYRKSEAMGWLMEQPACREVAEGMLMEMVRMGHGIRWAEKGKWVGNEALHEEEVDGMHELKRNALLMARRMPKLEVKEAVTWLMSQDEGFQFAAGRLWNWVKGKWIIRSRKLGDGRDPNAVRVWAGCGKGTYQRRHESAKKRSRDGLRAWHRERRAEMEAERIRRLPELQREKAERKLRADAKKRAAGFKPIPHKAEILDVMCSFPAGTPRAEIFNGARARFKVSPATLDRLRRELLQQGRLVQLGDGRYSAAVAPAPVAVPAEALEEPVLL